MRKVTILLALLVSISCLAQPNYKRLLQQLPQMNDHEALYKLDDYRAWFPKQPHPDYLLGNINWRLQSGEHALMDFQTKDLMLYNTHLYYGNCLAFIGEETVKAELYPETCINGKTSEEIVRKWLQEHMKQAKDERERCQQLYDDYCRMVNRYDTCLQLFTSLSEKYSRLKDMQLMLDDSDRRQLEQLSMTARHLPDDISRFQTSLEHFPIEGYQPTIRFRPISFYRLEGLTTSDFLQNDVQLWDYASWVEEFRQGQDAVTMLRQQMGTEQERLTSHQAGAENKTLLNTIAKYDETSPLIDLLHLEYLELQSHQLAQRIRRDSVGEDDLLEVLQLTRRLYLVRQESDVPGSLIGRLLDNGTQRRYRDFITRYYPNGSLPKAPAALEEAVNGCYQRTQEWVVSLPIFTHPVRISETLVAYPGVALEFREE